MAAIPVGNPVLEDSPCGAAPGGEFGPEKGSNRLVISLSGAGDGRRAPEKAFGTEKHVKTTDCAVTGAAQGGGQTRPPGPGRARRHTAQNVRKEVR